jgi:hypothetical protein
MLKTSPLREESERGYRGNITIYLYLPSLDNAPRRKKSQSVSTATAVARPAALNRAALRVIKTFFSCSKTVYCRTGLITRIKAGPIPRQKALAPSLARIFRTVSMKLSFLMITFASDGDAFGDSCSKVRTACEVWMTQMGLLMMVVADPVPCIHLLGYLINGTTDLR